MDAWMEVMQPSRNPQSRWTIMPADFFPALCDHRSAPYLPRAEGHMSLQGWPAWAAMDSVIMPICVQDVHWVVGELNLNEMKLMVYDIDPSDAYKKTFNGWMTAFRLYLSEFLLHMGETSRAERTGSMENVWVRNMPPHTWDGDSGPMSCQVMSLLCRDLIPSRETLTDGPREFRYHMANILWNSRSDT